MRDQKLISHSPEETAELAKILAKEAAPGSVIALIGPMGAGKTAFSKAFGKALGIEATINSPTFALLNIYEEGRIPLYHFDAYRIEEPEEMYEIGFEEYIYGEGVCLIEWADLIKEILPLEYILVKIEVLPDCREITVSNIKRE